MKFINIVGTTASGKTVLARQLALKLNLVHIEMDDLFWLDNWRQTPDDEFFLKLKNKMDTAKNGWVLDGNYSKTLHLKLTKLDTIIWLDYSFSLNFYRSVKRTISRVISQEPLWEHSNNYESFRQSFLSKDSIILWMINHHAKNRKQYLKMMHDPQYRHIQFIRLTSSKQAKVFLDSL